MTKKLTILNLKIAILALDSGMLLLITTNHDLLHMTQEGAQKSSKRIYILTNHPTYFCRYWQ
jgi:hypothetical protein